MVYAGTMGPAQGLDVVLRAAKLIEESEPRVQFILVGGGIEVERLRTLAAEIGTTSVRIMPRMPQSEIGNLLAAADVLLVHLKDEPLFRITIPSKTQFYLAMGKPILMGIRGDAAELVERAGAGVVVEPQNAGALAGAVIDLARLPTQRARSHGRARTRLLRSASSAPTSASGARSRSSMPPSPPARRARSSSASSTWPCRGARAHHSEPGHPDHGGGAAARSGLSGAVSADPGRGRRQAVLPLQAPDDARCARRERATAARLPNGSPA